MTAIEIRRREERKRRKDEERERRRILRLPEVEERTGKKRSAIYEEIAAGTFPAPIPIGMRSVGWLEHEVEGWIDGRVAAREARRTVAA